MFRASWSCQTHLRHCSEGLSFSEGKSVRLHRNLALDSAIKEVAAALPNTSIDAQELDRILANFPEAAVSIWQPESVKA
ncbi:hypothetical protein B0E33_22890 [Roseibium algicola]|uniref:Uncharacterized protein n=1 Tax=Roseibium algicola TaxID=2857014 RepID=A0ABM6I6J9_9HYPH|nr:hypothetical protein B0E33_22890 [Roseibium aggregatum]